MPKVIFIKRQAECGRRLAIKDLMVLQSAAHYLRECLPAADFWDATVAAQTAETAPARVIDFLQSLPA